MEGIVAKRTLKKSYYENKNVNINNLNFNGTPQIKQSKSKKSTIVSTIKSKILFKISIQSISMISVMIFLITVKNMDIVYNSSIAKKLKQEYKKTYSINQILDNSKDVAEKIYMLIKPIMPDKIIENIKNIYEAVTINLEKKQNSEVEIYEESSINNKENISKENIGASVLDEEESTVTVVSSVSSEINIIEQIKNTKIEFVKPLNGTITSHFGVREVIFEGIDSYHTGTDIAAKLGTKIVSSISGKVTRAAYNKYNGNFVEVTNGDIKTIYCHMSKLSVKVGESVEKGAKIGEVGSTGLSTGPHLHFEIVYNGTKIDPEQVLEL